MTREQRLGLLERTESELSLRTQSDLLGLNRTSLYYQPALDYQTPAERACSGNIEYQYTQQKTGKQSSRP